MGQTDLAIRFLATNYLGTLLPVLLRGCEVEVIAVEQSEVKLVERQADYVARVRIDGVETILHVEFQSRHDDNLPARILAYHALLRHQHHPLPVRSLVVYLMHEAPPRDIVSSITPRRGDTQVSFCYDVFCPWEHRMTIEEVRRHPALRRSPRSLRVSEWKTSQRCAVLSRSAWEKTTATCSRFSPSWRADASPAMCYSCS